MQIGFKDLVGEMTKAKLSRKPELADLFVPTWPIGCRRATPGVGFLNAIQQDNVEVVRGAVTRATEKGLISTDGKEREFGESPLNPVGLNLMTVARADVVILATGFNTTFAPSFKVTGLNGFSPNTDPDYLDQPSAYMIVSTANLPNYFTCVPSSLDQLVQH